MWEENPRELFQGKPPQSGRDWKPNPHSAPVGIWTREKENSAPHPLSCKKGRHSLILVSNFPFFIYHKFQNVKKQIKKKTWDETNEIRSAGNLFQNLYFLRPDEKRNAGNLFSIKYIFSGQMKYGAPENVFCLFFSFFFFRPDETQSAQKKSGKIWKSWNSDNSRKTGIPVQGMKLNGPVTGSHNVWSASMSITEWQTWALSKKQLWLSYCHDQNLNPTFQGYSIALGISSLVVREG